MLGWMAIATGIAMILTVIFIILFFTVGGFFGTLNDIFNGVTGILILILAFMLYAELRSEASLLVQIALILASIGTILVVIGSMLIIFDFTGWVLAGWYTTAGNALIGLWLMAFSYSIQRNGILPDNLVTFGLVIGALMAIGLMVIPGIFAGIDTLESAPWYLNLGFLGFLGTYILYPIWSVWLGRILLSR